MVRPFYRMSVAVALAACAESVAPGVPQGGILVNGVRTAGTTNILLIPALYADAPPPTIDHAHLNSRLFDPANGLGTLTGYFLEASGGRFQLNGTVTQWTRTAITRDAGRQSPGRQAHVIALTEALDPTIDFGRFDNDGLDGRPNSGDDDGIVDGGLIILNSERTRTCGAGPAAEARVWPHISRVSGPDGQDSAFTVADKTPGGVNIRIRAFTFQSALQCDGEVAGFGIIAHEAMHLLFRTPEAYSLADPNAVENPDGRIWRTGCWDIMAAGSGWGCGNGPMAEKPIPVHTNPYYKEQLGWIQSDTIGVVADTTITLRPAALKGRTFRILVGPDAYYEVEYRQQMGYDHYIPGSGVLVYHTDRTRTTTPGCVAFCGQPFMVIEGDVNNTLQTPPASGGNRGELGDSFGGAGRTTFTAPAPSGFRILSVSIDEAGQKATVRIANQP